MKKLAAWLLALVMLAALIPGVLAADGAVTAYTPLPGAVESTVYTVTVNGQKVFVEKFLDISYARFSFSGTANVTVGVQDTISSSDISPHSYNIKSKNEGKTMSFSLSQARKLIIEVNDYEKLFLFADDPEAAPPQLRDEGVYNVLDYPGIDPTGSTLNTKEIQAALDDVSAKGGVLYFPNGKYFSGTLHIKSNTTVYLQDGALIQGSDKVEEYPRPIVMQDGTEVLVGALICFDQAENAKIIGRGVIGGGGKNLRLGGRDAWLVEINESSNVGIEDIVLRDPSAFNSHFCYSDNVFYKNVKLINDISVPNTDGIDPDSCVNVTIDGVFSYCSDDSISLKTHRYSTLVRDSHDITVKNCVFWTKKSALKIGDETFAYNMYNFTFENNDIVHADRGVVAYVCDGTTLSNVYWVNNRLEEIGGDTFERLIDIWVRTREESMSTPGKIQNLVIKDLYAEQFSKNNSYIEGLSAESCVENVYIDNFVVGGKKVNSLAEAKIDINSPNYVKNIVFGPVPELPPYAVENSFTPGTFLENGGMVSFEAERYFRQKTGEDAWVLDGEKRGGLGEGSLKAQGGGEAFTDFENSPRLDYHIDFNTTGTFYAWARMYAQNPDTGYLAVGLDGGSPVKIHTDKNPGGWYWSDKSEQDGYATLEIKEPGVHTVNVYMGSRDLHFDKMFLLKADSGEALPGYFSPGHKGMGPKDSDAYPGLPVTIDGNLQNYEVPATILNDRTVVPMRAIFEALGAKVEWKDPVITAAKDGKEIILTIGSDKATVNGGLVTLDQPPVILSERTMVPVRFVGEALGVKVDWVDTSQLVQIGDPSLRKARAASGTVTTTTPGGTGQTQQPQQAEGTRYEAEALELKGYEIENNAFASKNICIKTPGIGTATLKYDGEEGSYGIKIAYFDENDGAASYKLSIDGKTVDQWTADQDLGNASPITQTLTWRAINDCALKPGSQIVLEGTMEGGDAARVDYIELVDGHVEPPQTAGSSSGEADADGTLRIEAEGMTLNGYEIESNSFASKSMCVKTGATGTAAAIYNGEPGLYAIKVAYFDENDGAAGFRLLVDDKVVDKWSADQDLGNASPIAETHVEYVVGNVELKKGSEIKVEGTMDAGEAARLDYIEITDNSAAGTGPGQGKAGTKFEAEKMALTGYEIETNTFASEGQCVKTIGKGTAELRFKGNSGTYGIRVAYFDENDGRASYRLTVDGSVIAEWTADQDLESSAADTKTRAFQFVEAAALKNNSKIVIEGTADGGEPARLDYLEII